MEYRFATEQDLDLLAEWNHQLIRDEGYTNPMTVVELKARMGKWIANEYRAVFFLDDGDPVAYALFRENEAEVYLRQFFVRRGLRRKGIGKRAILLLRERAWPQSKRLTVEVLAKNASALQFWRAVGYHDYSVELEIRPNTPDVADALYHQDKSGERMWSRTDLDP